MNLQKSNKYRHKIKRIDVSFIKNPEPTPQNTQSYITFHNKLNVEHRNRQFKNIYIKLNIMHEPKNSYKMLFHIDIVHVINKLLREFILNKQLLINHHLTTLINKAQNSIEKIHKLFILDQSVTNNIKKINFQYQTYINPFFNAIITFHMRLCIINLMQNKVEIAKKYYQAVYKIAKNISTSLTSNFKLLRKIGQFFIVYAVFLINSHQFNQAIDLLFQALNNETNILVILVWRGKQKSKSDLKRRKIQLYNRLFAIFLNLSTCFQQKYKLHWVYICLKQCKFIGELKQKQLQNDIKLIWPDLLKKYKLLYNEYIQMKKIIEIYFNKNHLIQTIDQYKKYQIYQKSREKSSYQGNKIEENGNKIKEYSKEMTNQSKSIKFQQELHQAPQNININKENNAQSQLVKHNKPKSFKNVRRSLSLQDNLIKENQQRLLKDYGHQILFLGVDLFNTNIFKKQKSISSQTRSNISKLSLKPSTAQLELKSSYLISQIKYNEKVQSKLKKKKKKIENKLFKNIQQPLCYDEVQKKMQNFWNQQQLQNNKAKQQHCLVKYKSQYLNNKKMIKQQENIKQQIQIINKKDKVIYKDIKNHQIQEEQKEKGINLFKKIILKNIKMIDIKKNQQLITILKKKRQAKLVYNACSYSEPQFSIDYLIEKIKKQKNREELIQKTKNEEKNELIELKKYKGKQYNHTFLTKNTQIPNLFLSFISKLQDQNQSNQPTPVQNESN